MNAKTIAILAELPQLKATIGRIGSIEIRRIAEEVLSQAGEEGKKLFLILDERGAKLTEVGWEPETVTNFADIFGSGRRKIEGEDVGNALMRLAKDPRDRACFVAEVGSAKNEVFLNTDPGRPIRPRVFLLSLSAKVVLFMYGHRDRSYLCGCGA